MEFLLLMALPMIISLEQILVEPFSTDLVANTQLPNFLLLKPRQTYCFSHDTVQNIGFDTAGT